MERHSQLDGMLDQAQSSLVCPVCHRKFKRDELRLRGLFERHGIIQVTCSENHNPTVVIFIANERTSKTVKQNEKPLTANDVLELHKAIESFDGNFRKYFKPNR